MHRSRVHAVRIDTPEAEAAAGFWSAALGVSAEADPAEPRSTVLHHALPGLVTAVQRVDDAPRFHLDIETDDVDAETARLVLLGAAEVAREHGRRVLRTPGGHVVCIVPVRSDPEDFAAGANTWIDRA
ncbi:MAG TPA: VOC family protein [Glycomyces sp.]|nr:VOC family protein [Glycomyces sp.]